MPRSATLAANLTALPGAAVAPVVAAATRVKYLEVPVVPQAQWNWCWAAVTTAIARFRDGTFALGQCEVAAQVLANYLFQNGHPPGCCPPGVNPGANVPWEINDALFEFGLYHGSPAVTDTFFRNVLVPEIDDNKPMVAQIDWGWGGPLHVVTVCGYEMRVDGDYVEVNDPELPDGGIQNVWPYQSFLNGYRGTGRVLKVFRTR